MLEIRKPDAHGNQRLILIRMRAKTQSVNICGPSNVPGDYAGGWVYFARPFMVDANWFALFATFEATMNALRKRDYRQHS